jgi:transcriptional regulator with XRE-family HTH domain
MINNKMIGEKFRKLREANNLTQGQIAEYLAVDQSMISRYEQDERQFSITMLEKISDLFGCSVEYFLSDDGYDPVPFSLRADHIQAEDLETIAVINRIALNLRMMKDLLEGDSI